VLAYRLTADPSTTVLVLEAGTGRASMAARLLVRLAKRFAPQLRWEYETVPQEGMLGRAVYLPQGRMLGGGTAVNAMTYVRGQAGDYELWRRLVGDSWSYERVLDAFKRLENNRAITDRFHGQGGPLTVDDQVRPHLLTRTFIEAAQQVGIPFCRDFNGATQEGVGLYQVTQVNGRRHSAADAFLHPVEGRPNLTVLTGSYATKLLVERGRAIGVEFRTGGGTRRAHAAREVLVCGGAINSPKLLLLSGIGSGDHLRRLGIPVVHDLPGVGQNLHDHLNVQVITRCSRPITYDHWDRPLPFLKQAIEFLLFNTGRATSNLSEGAAFLRSNPEAISPDIQLHFLPLIWRDCGREHVDDYGMTLEAAFLQPESRGTVTLASTEPSDAPLIDPRYCTRGVDLERLVGALRRCREIMAADAFRPYTAGELFPGPDKRSDEELAEYVRRSGTTTYHPVGTCKMGNDALAVVNPELKVRGLEGLRVVDSSIMPQVVSGSTQAPSMMIGEMGAAIILA